MCLSDLADSVGVLAGILGETRQCASLLRAASPPCCGRLGHPLRPVAVSSRSSSTGRAARDNPVMGRHSFAKRTFTPPASCAERHTTASDCGILLPVRPRRMVLPAVPPRSLTPLCAGAAHEQRHGVCRCPKARACDALRIDAAYVTSIGEFRASVCCAQIQGRLSSWASRAAFRTLQLECRSYLQISAPVLGYFLGKKMP